MRDKLTAICGATILATMAMPSFAVNAGRGVGYVVEGPAFDLPADMSVERQEVHVSLHSVRLTYVFKSPTHQTIHFSFALPDMPVDASPDAIGLGKDAEPAGLSADTQPLNYLNLAVRVNDKPLTLAGHGRALFGGKDVTRQLLDAGVPLLYNLDGDAPWSKLAPAVRTKLEASRLLDVDAAQWTYQASFKWDQTFEPGETRIEVAYTPVADYWSDITLDHFPEIAPGGSATRTYCIDDALRRAFSRKPTYELYTVTHGVASPGGWRGPVGHYRLVVDKGAAANLVAFCPLAAKKISLTTFEWTAKDFIHDREMGVLFFVDPDAATSNTQK